VQDDLISLEAALTDLEAAIPDEPVEDIEVCTHCFSPSDEAALAGSRVAMPLDTVASVAAADPFHWGDNEKFRRLYSWLTPRIVREFAFDQLHVDEALIGSRLVLAGALESGSAAAQAHDRVLLAMWIRTLRAERRLSAVDFLEYVAPFRPTLEPYLSMWQSEDVGPPDAHAAELIGFWIPDLLSGSLNVGWWDEIDIAEPITAWLLTDGQFRAYRHGLSDDVLAKLSLFLAAHVSS
jgi:hypothetical protein